MRLLIAIQLILLYAFAHGQLDVIIGQYYYAYPPATFVNDFLKWNPETGFIKGSEHVRNLDCIRNTLFKEISKGEIEKYEASYLVEGYQEIISLYPDSVFSYQLVTRMGHQFSSGKWQKMDSLLYLHSEPKNFRKVFKRERRNTSWRRHQRIEFAQVYVISDDGICLQKRIK